MLLLIFFFANMVFLTSWEGEKRSWNRSTTSFDHVTKNTGHWGPTYAGCGRVRKGLVEYLEGTAAIDVRGTH